MMMTDNDYPTTDNDLEDALRDALWSDDGDRAEMIAVMAWRLDDAAPDADALIADGNEDGWIVEARNYYQSTQMALERVRKAGDDRTRQQWLKVARSRAESIRRLGESERLDTGADRHARHYHQMAMQAIQRFVSRLENEHAS